MNGKLWFLMLGLLGVASIAAAQDSGQVVPQGNSSWAGGGELRIVGGYSPRSNHLIGVSEGRKLIWGAVEYSHPIWDLSGATISYTASLVPVAIVMRPVESINGVNQPAGNSYGAGTEPIGFAAGFRRHARFQPIAEIAGGILYFNQQTPIAGSSQFNFTFHFGGGVEWYSHGEHILTVGYRYHHISNANTGQFNPGIDSNLIYIAFPIWLRAKVH